MKRIFRFQGQERTQARSHARRLPRLDPSGQAGFTLIEVLVGASLLVAVSVGMFGAIDVATRSTGQERHRARAHALAQQDQARLRSLRISDLANLNQTRTETQDGTPYTITSRGDFVTDSTGTAACTPGVASADYIKTTSRVTWPNIGSRPAVVSESIVSPPSGSIAPNRGALAIQVNDQASQGVSGVAVSGSGAGSFSGSTGSTGCVIFGDLPNGNYTLTPSAPGLVDRDGNPAGPQPTSVIGGSTNTVVLQYGQPGSIGVSFTTRVGGNLVPATTDSIMVFNTGMTQAERFGNLGAPAASITAAPLFPFTSPDTVYAGTCTGDNPNPSGQANPPGGPAMASVTVPPGGSPTTSIQLPALNLTVRTGSGPSSPGSVVSGARVRVYDRECSSYARTFTTNSAGELPNASRGLPYSVHHVCAEVGSRRAFALDVSVKNFGAGTSLVLYGTGSSSSSGSCP